MEAYQPIVKLFQQNSYKRLNNVLSIITCLKQESTEVVNYYAHVPDTSKSDHFAQQSGLTLHPTNQNKPLGRTA